MGFCGFTPAGVHSQNSSGLASLRKDLRKMDFSTPEDGGGILEQKLQKLKVVSDKVDRIAFRIGNADKIREKMRKELVMYKLFYNTFKRTYEGYDTLASSKHRYSAAGCVEELMKILCELDQVQSDGIEEVRVSRKELTRRINNELLPLADKSLSKAEKLLAFTKMVLAIVEYSKRAADREANEENSMNIEETDAETESVDEQVKRKNELDRDVVMAESEESIPTKRRKPSDDEREETDDEAQNTKEANTAPLYKIRDMGNKIDILVQLPLNESSRSIGIELEDDGNTLLVYGKAFQLPFEVNQRKFNARASTYQFLNPRLLSISIPKRSEVPVRRTGPRSSFYQQQPRSYHPFYNNRQPMGWAW